MKKEITAVICATAFIISTAPFLSQAIELEKNLLYKNQQVYLGRASINGDGTEINSTVDAYAENDIAIKISSATSLVDFYINYSITCSGPTDSGLITLIMQINQEEQGHVETIAVDVNEGKLILEDIEIKRGDIITFEIGLVYTNLIPSFVIPHIALGGGIVHKKTHTPSTAINSKTILSSTDPPTIEIVTPKTGYLYLFDREILPIGMTLIIGPITIHVTADDQVSGVDHVEFYVDDLPKGFATTVPYNWLWNTFSFGQHTLTAVVHDVAGNNASASLTVWKFL